MRATTVSPCDRPGRPGAVAPVTVPGGRSRPTVALTFPAQRGAGRQRLVGLLRRLAELRPEVGAAKLDHHDLLDPAVISTLAGRPTPVPGTATTDQGHHDPRDPCDHPGDDRGGGRMRLAASPIELVAAARADGWPLLHDPGADVDWEATAGTARALRTDLGRALDVLHHTQLGLHRALEGSTRLVVTYAGAHPGSFAALAAHGAVFLNCRPGDGLPYAIEELAHQGGHVLLTTLLFGREDEPFRVPADTPLAPTDPDQAEDRTVLVLLHAVFTEALMAASLWAALDDPLLGAIECHEVHGRLELVLRRFRHDLVDLLDADVLGLSGLALAASCRQVFELTVDGWARHAPPCDLSGQPYAFCRRTFLDRNPAPPPDQRGSGVPRVPAVAII